MTIALTIGTVFLVLVIAATRGVAGVDPHESDGRATSTVVAAPESFTSLTARCPEGHIADGGTLEVRPSDALVVATGGMAVSVSSQWTVEVVSGDHRPVTVVAAARCEPQPSQIT